MPHQLAIDFGTTNTVLARWNADLNCAETVMLPGLSQPAESSQPALVLRSLDDPVLAVRYAAGLSWLELCGTACLKDYAARIEQACGKDRQPLLRALFHASNYLGIELSAPDVLATLLPALLAALHDDHPATRLGATWPLAWMQHPQADEALRSAFAAEMDADAQAEMLYIIHSLSPKLGAELLLTAESSPAEVVQQMAARLRLFR